MIKNFMADKLIITFDQYTKIVEKLAIEIHKSYKPTVSSWYYARGGTHTRHSL